MTVKTSHVVIDVETLHLVPTAAVIAFAASTAEGIEFKWNFSIADNMRRSVSPSTVEWHKEKKTQDYLIYSKSSTTAVTLPQFLIEWKKWLDVHTDRETLFWSQGTDFDFPVMKSFTLGVEGKWAWFSHQNVRDLRTLIWVLSGRGLAPAWRGNNAAHNAMEDVRDELVVLKQCLRELELETRI